MRMSHPNLIKTALPELWTVSPLLFQVWPCRQQLKLSLCLNLMKEMMHELQQGWWITALCAKAGLLKHALRCHVRSRIRDKQQEPFSAPSSRSYLPFEVLICPADRTVQCPYSWVQATTGSLVYPVRQKHSLYCGWRHSRCNSCHFALIRAKHLPWLHNSAPRMLAMTPPTLNTCNESNLYWNRVINLYRTCE